ncbi:hypothetical protein LXL04_033510 [Taraxacum kok-saghyz]
MSEWSSGRRMSDWSSGRRCSWNRISDSKFAICSSSNCKTYSDHHRQLCNRLHIAVQELKIVLKFEFMHKKLFILSITCSLYGQPLLASGVSSGVISIWNLEKRRLQSVIRDAHVSSVISLHFFANEPVLMSISADNSIKMRREEFQGFKGTPIMGNFVGGEENDVGIE